MGKSIYLVIFNEDVCECWLMWGYLKCYGLFIIGFGSVLDSKGFGNEFIIKNSCKNEVDYVVYFWNYLVKWFFFVFILFKCVF